MTIYAILHNADYDSIGRESYVEEKGYKTLKEAEIALKESGNDMIERFKKNVECDDTEVTIEQSEKHISIDYNYFDEWEEIKIIEVEI